jgi:catechol 2,3-dioxygenase-like lactoylglutathione lyase family enzyme
MARVRPAVFALFLIAGLAGRAGSQTPDAPPPAASQVTFLYFNDIEKAAAFYGRTLGLKNTLNLEWVKMFETAPGAQVGLVGAGRGAHRPSPQKPVMISLVVPRPADVDRWHAFLKARGVLMRSEPRDSGSGAPGDANVRAFGFMDPEGHTLEVFAWRERRP